MTHVGHGNVPNAIPMTLEHKQFKFQVIQIQGNHLTLYSLTKEATWPGAFKLETILLV